MWPPRLIVNTRAKSVSAEEATDIISKVVSGNIESSGEVNGRYVIVRKTASDTLVIYIDE